MKLRSNGHQHSTHLLNFLVTESAVAYTASLRYKSTYKQRK